MKRVFILLAFLYFNISANSQIPQGFSYQAIARGSDGKEITNTLIGIKISILTDTTGFYGSGGGTYLWEEEQSIKTNSLGLVTLIVGNPLAIKVQGTAVSFSSINWKHQPLYFGTKINHNGWRNMGAVQLLSVPYSMVAGELDGTVNKLEVIGEDVSSDEALFEVKRKDGQTMFAVYNYGVRVYMPLDTVSKAKKGGFAIGGFDKAKGIVQDYFVVNPDSIRAYIDTNSGKAKKGGFAIGGFDKAKAPNEEYLRVTRDSTRIYINNDIMLKAKKGGFAIGGFSNAKRLENDYMLINPDSTNFFVRSLTPETSSSFNIIGIDQNNVRNSLLTANPDTISISGILKIQNNLNVITSEISSITLTSATSGGNVKFDGGLAVTSRGVCWSTLLNPTVNDQKTNDGIGLGSFTSNITGLTPGITYHIRAYATNTEGTVYGADVPFKTNSAPVIPTVTTNVISSFGTTTASCGGNVTFDGGSSVIARGVCWGAASNPTTSNSKTDDGIGSGSFLSGISGLTPGTTYHFRAYAANSAGTAYGADISFTTKTCIEIITSAITSVTSSAASAGGSIVSGCGDIVTARGICWSLTSNPTIADSNTSDGSGSGAFSSNLSGLSTGILYYVRAYATTGTGTYYGNQMSFMTLSSVLDYDGNSYTVIPIGTQSWLKENLKTGRLNDGSPIPLVTDGSTWSVYTTPAYCHYNTDVVTFNTYGALYNWYAVNSGKLCPTGWHVPTYTDWLALIAFLGNTSDAGGKLKEAGTSHWTSPNTGATNEFGFTALPGGCDYTGSTWNFFGVGSAAFWWSSTPTSDPKFIYCPTLDFSTANLLWAAYMSKSEGLSVRCIKD